MSYQAVSHTRSHRVPFHGFGLAPTGDDLTPYSHVAALEAARKIMTVVAAQPKASRAAVIRAALEQIRPGLFAKVEGIASGVVARGGSPATAYEEALRSVLEAEYKRGLSGCSGCGDGIGAADWASAAGSIAGAAATIASIASGAPQQAARAARDTMLAAQANAGSAATTAAAQVEIARIQAETARLAAQQSGGGGKSTMIIAAVGGLALLGVLGFVLLKK